MEEGFTKSSKQDQMSSVRRVKSRDAARNRRKKETDQFAELAKLLPLPESITSQLDKASIVRLAISFMKYKEFIGAGGSSNAHHGNMMMNLGQGTQNNRKPQSFSASAIEKNMSHHLLNGLDGFIFVVSHKGNFIYVSETVEKCLGLRQLDLIGTSSFNIIHPDHHSDFLELLCSPFKPNYSNDFLESLDNAMHFPEIERIAKSNSISLDINMKCNIVKRGSASIKSSGFKLIHVTGQMLPFKNVDHNGEQSYGLVAFGQPLLPPTINELRLDSKVFVSRVGMDLKIAFCEGKIRKFMKFTAKDIVGMCAYNFYHENDMAIVGDAHTDCIDTGKCVSRVYRWMNKTGGWVWMQTVGTVISRKTPKGEEKQILCVNYISSEIEHEDEIVHAIQLKFKQLAIEEKQLADNFDDFGLDGNGPVVPSTEDLNSQNTETADKESYIKSITHYNKYRPINISDEPVKPNPQIFGANPMATPNLHSRLSPNEASLCRATDRQGTLQLIEELKANPLPPMYDEFPLSPASCSSLDYITPIDFTNPGVQVKDLFSSNNSNGIPLRDNAGYNDVPIHGREMFDNSSGIVGQPIQKPYDRDYGMKQAMNREYEIPCFPSNEINGNIMEHENLRNESSYNFNNNYPRPLPSDHPDAYSSDSSTPSPKSSDNNPSDYQTVNIPQQNQYNIPTMNNLNIKQEPIDTMDVDGVITSQSLLQTSSGNYEYMTNSVNIINMQQQSTANEHCNGFGVIYVNEFEPDFPSPEIGDNLQPINNQNLSSFNLNMQTNNMNPYIQSPYNIGSSYANYGNHFRESHPMQANRFT